MELQVPLVLKVRLVLQGLQDRKVRLEISDLRELLALRARRVNKAPQESPVQLGRRVHLVLLVRPVRKARLGPMESRASPDRPDRKVIRGRPE
jgi:hypothetical protein